MAYSDQILNASFKGIPFLVDSSTLTGGRKTVTHEFVNSDKRFVEDMGLLNKTFTFQATITGPQYKIKRDALINVLEQKDSGILIHPYFGIQRVVAKPYNLQESQIALGEGIFTLTFENAQDAILPKPITGTVASVLAEVNQAVELIKTSVIQLLVIKNSDNFLDALSNINQFLGTVGFLTNEYVSDSETFDTFSKGLASFTDNASKILSNSVILSDNIADTFSNLDDAISRPSDSVNLFNSLYTYNDNQTELNVNTAKNTERIESQNILNGSIQTLALIFNYKNAVQKNYLTVDEINLEKKSLDEQYEKIVQNPVILYSNTSALNRARNQVRDFFDKAQLTAYKVDEYETKKTTILNLTYTLYGNLENIDNIINLNGFRDLQNIQGKVKILTL